MAISNNTMRFLKGLYWILVITLHIYICYQLFLSERVITCALWFVAGFILIVIMYSIYFPQGADDSSWPPYVSTCPDYLTVVSPTACMDFVGLNSPLLKKADPTNMPAPTSSDSSQYVFNPTGSAAEKARKAQQYGLTWEGIA
jgi:hypothetical protein